MSARTTEKVWAGPVTAYALEVAYNGYTGTLQEWLQHLAETTDNAEAAARYAALAQEAAVSAAQIPAAVRAALETIATATDEKLDAIRQAGTTWQGNVEDEGAAQVTAVGHAGEDATASVTAAGGVQLQEISDEGTTQVGLVTDEGTAQIAAVEAKGEEVLDSIPSDYSALVTKVNGMETSLKSGLEADAEWHLGFYLDANGDLCQVEEE